MLSRDTLLVEFPFQWQGADRTDFYMMAVPLRIQGIDSSGCRLLAVMQR